MDSESSEAVVYFCNNFISNDPPCEKMIKYLCAINGFHNRLSGFEIKELSILNRDTMELNTEYYRVGKFTNLHQLDQKMVKYVTFNVHGLRYGNETTDKPQCEAFIDLERACDDARNDGGRLIGYKGCAPLLEKLKSIDRADVALDIEEYECPTFDVVAKQYPNVVEEFYRNETCARHSSIVKRRRLESEQQSCIEKKFCSRVRVLAFDHWLKQQQQQYNDIKK